MNFYKDGQRMSATAELIEKYRTLAGREIHLGLWLQIDQQRIDDFARVTGDQQWIHTDPQRAAKESPYGTTIAHGFLTLSLLPYLIQSNHPDFFTQLPRHAPAGQLRF
jgi:acyl dehydratase